MTTERTDEWLSAARHELGLEDATDGRQALEAVDRLDALVEEQVDHSVAASTVFLLGVAAGRSADPAVTANDFTEKLGALARSWNADTERGEAPNDQQQRG